MTSSQNPRDGPLDADPQATVAEEGEMDMRDRELAVALLQDKLAEPLSEDALKELTTLYTQLSAGLDALDALNLSHIEPAVRFVMSEGERNED